MAGYSGFSGGLQPSPYVPSYGQMSRTQFAPKTGPQYVTEMGQANAMLPPGLQVGAARVGQGAINRAENRYKRDVARPMISALRSNLASSGRDSSTFGAAELASMKAEQGRQAYYAGQDMVDRALERWKLKNDTYFNNVGRTVQSDQGGSQYGGYLTGMANAYNGANSAYWGALTDFGRLGLAEDQFGFEQSKYGDQKNAFLAQAGMGALGMFAPYFMPQPAPQTPWRKTTGSTGGTP
jgi:hypothetical protein